MHFSKKKKSRYAKTQILCIYLKCRTLHVNQNTFKPKTDPALKRDLAANLTREIDFYHYCRQRLHKQFLLIQDKEKKDEGADSLLEKAR